MTSNVIGEMVSRTDFENRTKRSPNWHPVTHVRGECNCELEHVFKTTPHQAKTELFTTKEIFTKGNAKTSLSLTAIPSRNLKSSCKIRIETDKTGIKTISYAGSKGALIASPEVYLPTGGFLSLYIDAAKNVFIARRQVNVTRIDVNWNWLGGPGGGWNRMSFSFSERGPAVPCKKGECENIGTQTGRSFGGRIAKSLLDDYSPYSAPPGGGDHEWLSFYPPGGSFTLYPNTYYYAHAYDDVGAQTGWFGKPTDPPWGEFVKSMRGYVSTVEECGGPPEHSTQCNLPECNLALAMRIYTDTCPEPADSPLQIGDSLPAQDGQGFIFYT